ncbi:helix-turn-helix transcriptional regulator [Fodinicola feengrottensis]|uniref:Transcriptional regulator DauR n=1 Tax=Fodinicola feengrottensis TaxID=435914 RepID=A0ABN2GMX8_9ACTN|nr:PAS domain-containing protein [Fodinicola feengrottensis]
MLEVPPLPQWSPICAAIARLLAPHAEVLLHDVRTDRVVGIWNPMSGRQRGDESLLNELDGLPAATSGVYGPYPKHLPDGRQLSSVSAVIPGADGHPETVLCVNLDRGPLEQAAALLAAFAAPAEPRPEPLFVDDWREKINDTVGSYVREYGRSVDTLTTGQRMAIIDELDAAGIFKIRGAAPLVAGALRISRSSLYNYLTDVRATR